MQVWLPVAFTDTRQLVGIARKAEELGFAGISLADHVFTPNEIRSPYPYSDDGKVFWPPETPWPDPWVAVGAMAAVTTRLRFLTTIYILPLRNVFAVAQAVGTAAVIADNRVSLGVGAGWMKEEFDQLREDFRTRGARMDEMIEVLRRLWGGGMVEHHGRFHDFGPLQMSPVPSEPVPILVGGVSDAALSRAARLGDGWVGNRAFTFEEIEEYLQRFDRLRREAGRDHLPFDVRMELAAPRTPDNLRRLDEMGIHAVSAAAWDPYAGAPPTLEAKEEAMERYAEEVLQKL